MNDPKNFSKEITRSYSEMGVKSLQAVAQIILKERDYSFYYITQQ
jgi:hypothetical protein